MQHQAGNGREMQTRLDLPQFVTAREGGVPRPHHCVTPSRWPMTGPNSYTNCPIDTLLDIQYTYRELSNTEFDAPH
jgi:hypothetical protein